MRGPTNSNVSVSAGATRQQKRKQKQVHKWPVGVMGRKCDNRHPYTDLMVGLSGVPNLTLDYFKFKQW